MHMARVSLVRSTRPLRSLRLLPAALLFCAALGFGYAGSGWANAGAEELDASGEGLSPTDSPAKPSLESGVNSSVMPRDGARAPLRAKKLYSQFNEELIIRHFFEDRPDGFFVDVGSWHWKMKSTTLYLEKHLGWSGIALDALPEVEAGYLEHRPRTKFYHRIVTDHSGSWERSTARASSRRLTRSISRTFPGQKNASRKSTVSSSRLMCARRR